MKKPLVTYHFHHREDADRLYWRDYSFSIKIKNNGCTFIIDKASGTIGIYVPFKNGELDIENYNTKGLENWGNINESLYHHIKYYLEYYNNLVISNLTVKKYNL